jgi:MerR family mercuric resistance operon transcriptional regulator
MTSDRAKRRTIGQLAADLGVSVETIRFYERRGLIDRPAKPADGFRHYGDDIAATIRYIRLAQDFGLTLKDVERLKGRLHGGPQFCETLRATVRERRDRITAEIAQLEHLRSELDAFLDRCSSRAPDLPCPIVRELQQLENVVVPRAAPYF